MILLLAFLASCALGVVLYERCRSAELDAVRQALADAERSAEVYRARLLAVNNEMEAKLCAAFNDGWMARDVAGVAQ